MSSRVFVFISEGDEPTLVWAVLDPARPTNVTWGRLDHEGLPPSGGEVIAIAPGADVGLHLVPLPARSDRQARTAAPYAVEDIIAQPVGEVHVALGQRVGEGDRMLAVVTCARMEQWLAILDEAGLAPAALVADYALLPGEADSAAIVDLGDRVLARLPDFGFAAEPELASALLTTALADPDIASIAVWSDTPHELVSGRTADANRAADHHELARLLSRGFDARPPLDLLQGAFKRRSSNVGVGLRRWRFAASMTAAVAVGWLALQGAQAFSYNRKADRLYNEAETLFRQAFPDVQRIVNLESQMRSRLRDANSGGGSTGFLDLTATLFASLEEAPNIQLEALRYDAEDAELIASLVYNSYSDIEALQAAIARRNALVQEGSSRQFGDQVAGDVTVRFQ